MYYLAVCTHTPIRALLCQGLAEYSPRCPLWGQEASITGQPYYGYSQIGIGAVVEDLLRARSRSSSVCSSWFRFRFATRLG
eukprot:scaffold12848_cov140-Isochrysis_galbana.AAC.1